MIRVSNDCRADSGSHMRSGQTASSRAARFFLLTPREVVPMMQESGPIPITDDNSVFTAKATALCMRTHGMGPCVHGGSPCAKGPVPMKTKSKSRKQAARSTQRETVTDPQPIGYVVRNLTNGSLVATEYGGMTNAHLCTSLSDAHAVARLDELKDDEYRIEALYAEPAKESIVGFAIRQSDGELLGNESNAGNIQNVHFIEVGAKLQDAHRIAVGDECDKYEILPLYAGQPLRA
jgi:hypothetical protein